MSRAELLDIIHCAMWVLIDAGRVISAGQYEDAMARVNHFTNDQMREYANFIVPSGRRGHITLALLPPCDARAAALLVGLLRTGVDNGATK